MNISNGRAVKKSDERYNNWLFNKFPMLFLEREAKNSNAWKQPASATYWTDDILHIDVNFTGIKREDVNLILEENFLCLEIVNQGGEWPKRRLADFVLPLSLDFSSLRSAYDGNTLKIEIKKKETKILKPN